MRAKFARVRNVCQVLVVQVGVVVAWLRYGDFAGSHDPELMEERPTWWHGFERLLAGTICS